MTQTDTDTGDPEAAHAHRADPMGHDVGADRQALLRQRAVLAEFGRLALQCDDLDEILTRACHLVGEALGTELAKVMELSPDKGSLLVRAGVGWPPGVVGHTTVVVEATSSEGHALTRGEPTVSPDIARETRFEYAPFIRDAGVRALANVVILGPRDRPPYGLLQVDSRTPRDFTGKDVEFLRTYANLLGASVVRLREAETLRSGSRALVASEARLRTLLGSMPQLVWSAVGSGEWTWASPQWTAHTGLSQEASRGSGWLEALHPGEREAARRAWTVAQSDGLVQFDCRIRYAGSSRHCWFQCRGTPLRGEDGRITEWIGTCTDVDDQMQARELLARGREALEARVAERTAELHRATAVLQEEVEERLYAQEQLRQAEKLKAVGQLTGGIAHDFNNMLQGMSSSLGLLRRRAAQGRVGELGRYIDAAERSVVRAATFTHRLLAFARQGTLRPEPVDLDRIARGMEDMIRHTVGPAVQVELTLADGNWLVLCDPSQMESALLNLCVNARDAMPEGGWLTITTSELELSGADVAGHEGAHPGRHSTIAVSDTGTGMTPEVLARVFEPFFTTKPLGQGTGLGLSQIHGFVHQSGGLVQVETAPGRGTTVRLCLPMHAPNPQAAAVGPAAIRHSLLLVEDEPDVRELTAEALREHGFRVVEAETGTAALRLVQAGPQVDLLVTDVGLPGGVDGRQLAEAVRRHHPDLPVILVTGYATEHQTRGMDVLRKPFEMDQLVEMVRTKLEQED